MAAHTDQRTTSKTQVLASLYNLHNLLNITNINNIKVDLQERGWSGEDNIKTDPTEVGWEGMAWIDQTQNRDRWRPVTKTVMNLRVP
jgi:hypothetical protein